MTRASPPPRIPLLRPRPPRLSQLLHELEIIEASGVFSNYGPVNTQFGDGSVRVGIIAVAPASGSPQVNPGATKGYEGWPC